jgi:hypothetical protein
MGKALLIIVLGFSTIFGSILFSVTTNQQRSANAIASQYERWLVQNTLESATNVAISKLYRGLDVSDTLSFNNIDYRIGMQDATADSVNRVERDSLTIIATFESYSDTVRTLYMKPSYGYYYYFANTWPFFITYDNGDTLTGPIHANDQIQTANSPVFLASVSSSDNDASALGSAQFYSGIELGTLNIPMPDLIPLANIANSGGDNSFNYEAKIVFNPGGTYDVYDNPSGTYLDTRNISDYNGTIMSIAGNDIYVEGQIDGDITVLSARDIVIENSLTYTSPDADYIGLVAADDILIKFDTGITNIQVEGALVAMDSLYVENYQLAINLTLSFHGSITVSRDVARQLSIAPLLPLTFNRVHTYDTRYRTNTPPYYPRLNRYEKLYSSK